MNFNDKLDASVAKNNSLLCVGLDPLTFKGNSLKGVLDQTADLVCAYKPNIAFFAKDGTKGLNFLKRTIDYIHEHYQIPVILDAKRGDIPSTSIMYAKEVFDFFEVDAVTVNPYLGFDALEPFFQRKDKGIIVLCRTSNPSAVDFQDLEVGGEPLYIKVAQKVVEWNKKYHNLLMVVGATYPHQLNKVRDLGPDMTFLIPGIGPQGRDLEETLKSGLRPDKKGLIISASRSIIYAQKPRITAQKL